MPGFSRLKRGPSIKGGAFWCIGCGTSNTYRSKMFFAARRAAIRPESYKYPGGGNRWRSSVETIGGGPEPSGALGAVLAMPKRAVAPADRQKLSGREKVCNLPAWATMIGDLCWHRFTSCVMLKFLLPVSKNIRPPGLFASTQINLVAVETAISDIFRLGTSGLRSILFSCHRTQKNCQ